MDWMNYKTSFDDLDEWEMRNVAWAIRRSFITGDGENATGLSVLRQLDPVGERYFDYIQAALDQVTPEIQNMGVALRYI